MKNLLNAVIIVALISFLLVGCAKETVSPATQPNLDSSPEKIELTGIAPEPDQNKQMQEEDFVSSIMQAINQNQASILIDNYDSIYGEVTQDQIDALSGGLDLYHKYLKGEKLVKYEFQKIVGVSYDTPNTTGKQYVFTSETGIARDIIIKCYENGNIIYKYNDPLLFYGAETVNRAEAYLNAIQEEDIQYLYDYIKMAYEDGESSSYTDPNHNKNYVALAKKTIENYKNNFMLETMKYNMSGKISEACNSSIDIEFIISGLSPGEKAIEHKINGIFEFPMWSVNDSWFGNNN